VAVVRGREIVIVTGIAIPSADDTVMRPMMIVGIDTTTARRTVIGRGRLLRRRGRRTVDTGVSETVNIEMTDDVEKIVIVIGTVTGGTTTEPVEMIVTVETTVIETANEIVAITVKDATHFPTATAMNDATQILGAAHHLCVQCKTGTTASILTTTTTTTTTGETETALLHRPTIFPRTTDPHPTRKIWTKSAAASWQRCNPTPAKWRVFAASVSP
jgi:hypothetical protein